MTKFYISNNIKWEAHRSGWKYVLNLLHPYCTNHYENVIFLDGFIDATFGFQRELFKTKGVIPYKERWLGFWHHPINIPPWLKPDDIAPELILKNDVFLRSIDNCIGIFTFSKYLASNLKLHLPKTPIINLYHPTDFNVKLFNMTSFINDKKIIHIGSWLRKFTTFLDLTAHNYKKYILLGDQGDYYLRAETNFYNVDINCFADIQYATFLENDLYDELLSESIVFLDLYDSSANNTIIECIARCTPIVINKISAVVEYLGEDYPLYYNDKTEVTKMLNDIPLIKRATEYLATYSLREKLNENYFIDSFLQSCSSIIK